MIDFIKKFFEKNEEQVSGYDSKSKSHDIQVATCALLLEIANIDGQFSESERNNIISILKTDYKLSDEHTKELIKAADKELKGSVDLWHFTNLINRNYSYEEKKNIIEMLWKVVYSDGRLDKHEDYLIHKLAELLHLSHRELIDVKLKITSV